MKLRLVLLLLLTLLLSACQLSLAGDITPPPGSELSAEAGTPLPVEYPARLPDSESGAQLFIGNCAACHGPGGLGDGEQAAQLPFPPAPIGDPELAAASRPADWFRQVSSGDLDRYMPPFAGSLSVEQRWDVLAYVYGLSADQDLATQGEALSLEHEETIQNLFSQPAKLSELGNYSRQELAAQLQQAASLSAEEAAALAVYLQGQALGLGLLAADIAPEPEVPAQETEATETGEAPATEQVDAADEGTAAEGLEIYGTVSNGSGEALPVGLDVVLHSYEGADEVLTQVAPVAADGSYRFEGLPLGDGRGYLASVDYGGLSYFSDFVDAATAANREELPLVVFETTTDTEGLVIERVHLVFEFRVEGQLRVIQLVSITNQGREAVVPGADGQPVLNYTLPEGASNLVFEEGQIGDRYLPTEEGFGDLRAVLPGSGRYQILFAYNLPYNRSLDLEILMTLPVQVAAAFVAEEGIHLESDLLAPAGTQQVDDILYTVYQNTQALEAGENLEMQLSGTHPLGGFWLQLARNDALLIGLVALTAAVGLAWLWLRRMETQPRGSIAVLDAIVRLDEQFEAGDLSKNEHKRQRAALKEALRQAIKRENQND